ncbi:hypothetical protein BpHYR1_007419 [Brachionus plicatilis]|uniref:Uncharacterized protein n=1 Tax=Brachionus plicatilis TaxID=10195 RepID=A0A3M7SM68_BRAPC|nr:hypothetical protein BpHYR1_007419 [Brachionus plicatilis]
MYFQHKCGRFFFKLRSFKISSFYQYSFYRKSVPSEMFVIKSFSFYGVSLNGGTTVTKWLKIFNSLATLKAENFIDRNNGSEYLHYGLL